MARWWLMSSIVLVVTGAAGAVGQADGMSRTGMPEWAVGICLDEPAADADGQAMALIRGTDVGLTEPIRTQLANRETMGAAVGISDPLHARLTAWGRFGETLERPVQVQQRAMNQENIEAAAGPMQQMRERLAVMVGAP